ncbi:MAG: efflux RND transporter periplasmic adaptor subunit [Hyphomicrobiaceae bacterium]
MLHKPDAAQPEGRRAGEPKGGTAGAEAAGQRGRSLAARAAAAMRLLLKLLLPLAALAAGYAGFKYLKATRPEPPKQAQRERVFAVEMRPAVRERLQPTQRVFGTAVAGREVDIRALVAGRVVSTSPELREGGTLTSSETILTIDPFDYETQLSEAEALRAETLARIAEQEASVVMETRSLEHARAQLELAKADLGRAETLTRRGSLSERTLDDRQQIVLQRQQSADQMQNNLAVWKARIAQSKAAIERLDVSIARARRRIEETRLKAPFDALVTEVAAQTGRMVSVNDKIAHLVDSDWIEVRFTLSDAQYGRLAAAGEKLDGREISVRWTLGSQSFVYPARVVRTGTRIAATSGGVEVYARLADPAKPMRMRPGAFVSVEVPDIVFEDVVRIPNAALYNGDTVYVAKEGRLDPRKVELVGTADNELIVRGPFSEGDKIVTTRLSTPGKGVAVKEAPRP